MDEYYNFNRSHVPAYGSWDCKGDLPLTQCSESARQAGLLRSSYTEERDLYVAAGDSTPAVIVVPRRREINSIKKNGSVVWDCEFDMKEPPSAAAAGCGGRRSPLTSSVLNPKRREDADSSLAAFHRVSTENLLENTVQIVT